MIMEQWGEAQLMALTPAEEAEVQKITDYFLVCLLVCLRYGFIIYIRLSLNSLPSHFCLPSIGITGTSHPKWVKDNRML